MNRIFFMTSKGKNSNTWSTTVLKDAVALVCRLQNIISFQIAGALQQTLNEFLEPTYQLTLMILLSIGTELFMRIFRKNLTLHILHQTVVIQVGQSLLAFLASINTTFVASQQYQTQCIKWLLQTISLCLPAFLSTQMSQSDYIQNAISVYLYQYTDATSNIVVSIDIGVPPFFIAIVAILLSLQWPKLLNPAKIYTYFYKAFQMLLVELIMFTITDNLQNVSENSKFLLQIYVLFAIDFINEVKSNTLSEVRGYAIWRISKQITDMDMNILDLATSMSVSILLFIGRRLGTLMHISSSSMSLHTLTEIIFMSTTNLLLYPVVTKSGQTFDEHILRVMFLTTAAHTIENMLRSYE